MLVTIDSLLSYSHRHCTLSIQTLFSTTASEAPQPRENLPCTSRSSTRIRTARGTSAADPGTEPSGGNSWSLAPRPQEGRAAPGRQCECLLVVPSLVCYRSCRSAPCWVDSRDSVDWRKRTIRCHALSGLPTCTAGKLKIADCLPLAS